MQSAEKQSFRSYESPNSEAGFRYRQVDPASFQIPYQHQPAKSHQTPSEIDKTTADQSLRALSRYQNDSFSSKKFAYISPNLTPRSASKSPKPKHNKVTNSEDYPFVSKSQAVEKDFTKCERHQHGNYLEKQVMQRVDNLPQLYQNANLPREAASCNSCCMDKNLIISRLQKELEKQKQAFSAFQQKTIANQISILDTINSLQEKLRGFRVQNEQLKLKLSKLPCESEDHAKENFVPNFGSKQHCETKYSAEEVFSQLRQELKEKESRLSEVEKKYKKIKNVGERLIEMMSKVDGVESTGNLQQDVKTAWKWVKKVVWEYESIRKKAYQWKQAYDELNCSSVENEDSYD